MNTIDQIVKASHGELTKKELKKLKIEVQKEFDLYLAEGVESNDFLLEGPIIEPNQEWAEYRLGYLCDRYKCGWRFIQVIEALKILIAKEKE